MAVVPADYSPLEGSERAPAPGSTQREAANPEEKLTVTVRLRRRPDAPALPDFQNHRAGDAPFVSREEFADRYGADPADVERVRKFAESHGLTVEDSSLARRTVLLSGTVAQMSRAFGVELFTYDSPTGSYRGREGALHLPKDLQDAVEGVFGLDNRRQARPVSSGVVPTAAPVQGVNALTPPEVAALYNFPAGPANGQTIGLIEFGGGYNTSDISAFFKSVGQSTPSLTAVGVDGAKNSPGTDPDSDGEVALDIDVAGSVAPGAKIAVYFAPWTEQGWVDVVTTAIHDTANDPSVLSISWGWPEFQSIQGLTWTKAAIDAVNQTFQEAAALGVTVLAASGDSGSGCGIGDGKAHCLYPGSDPYITSCGGTQISNVSGSSFTEKTWVGDGATGGGISDMFGLPIWQTRAGVPKSANDGHVGRGIPDVAGNADPASGYPITVDGSGEQVGGTSAVAPLYAGLVALMNAHLGGPVGYLNPSLYTFPEGPVFRDVNDGASNATGGAPGYTAGAGWDACTGFGSIHGQLLQGVLGPGGEVISAHMTACVVPGTEILQLFYRGQDLGVWSRWRNPDGSWSGEQFIGGVLTSDITAAVVPGTDILQLFYRGQDLGVYSRWRNPDGSWSAEQHIGGVLTSNITAAVVPGTQILQLFYRGQDLGVYSRWRNPDGSWSAEQHIGGVLTSNITAAVVPGTQILQLFYRGQDHGVYSRWRNPDGSWSGEQHIGGILSSDITAAVVPGTEILQLFYRGQDHGVYSRWRNPNGSWSGEQHIGGILTSDITAAVVPGTEILQLFYRGQDDGVWSRWRNPNGTWSGEQDIGGVITSDITAADVPGTQILQLFYRGQDDGVWSRWRNPNGSWSGEQDIGGILS